MSLDRFSSSIEHLQEGGGQANNFNNAPPDIFYETSPAVLVFIDGDPILEEVEISTFKYVMNTPFFLVLNASDKKYYLKGGEWWYSSREIIAVAGNKEIMDNGIIIPIPVHARAAVQEI